MKPPLNCIEERSFEESKKVVISELKLTETEFDEAYLFPLQQLIAYNPILYPEIGGSCLRVFATDATPHYPSIYIAYTFDNRHIILHYTEIKQS